LFGIGYNFYGSIGDGTDKICEKIKQIEFFKNIFIVNVVCGSFHCLAISKNGEIFAWGDNRYNEIGISGDDEKQFSPIKIFKI
jgi:alpha-tubulin suppressor-like RCC1 family protein